MRYRFYTVDVFTEQPFGGNPLAVIPDARGLGVPQMKRVAREFNFSETVFVFPPVVPEHTCRLRIFSPTEELPFAGHPTIGTAVLLAKLGRVALEEGSGQAILEEEVGPVRVSVVSRAGRPMFAQLATVRLPEVGPVASPSVVAALLSLDEADVLKGENLPQAVSCGVSFLIIRVSGLAAIRRIRLNVAKWEAAVAGLGAPNLFVYTRETESPGADIHARMFSPALGVLEDPATGAASAALAGYLARRATERNGTFRWVVEQGLELGRPSLLYAEADKRNGVVTAVRVGGSAVLISEGEMDIPAVWPGSAVHPVCPEERVVEGPG